MLDGCQFKLSGEYKRCRDTNGQCVKMWDNGCEIYKCCKENNVHFCGLCDKFPCDWLISKISVWNPKGIENLEKLAKEYYKYQDE